MAEKTVTVVSVDVMRESDAKTIAAKTPSLELMRRAGQSIVTAGRSSACGDLFRAPVAICCGKGNNAGDGYVAALYLKAQGIESRLLLLDSERFSADGRYYFDRCAEEGIEWELYSEKTGLSSYGSILDCLLGTGFQGTVRGSMADMITEINDCHEKGIPVIAADINSGLNGDTGEGELFVHSDLTVSIGTFKYGHFIGRAAEAMKHRVNADIGIEICGPSEKLSVTLPYEELEHCK